MPSGYWNFDVCLNWRDKWFASVFCLANLVCTCVSFVYLYISCLQGYHKYPYLVNIVLLFDNQFDLSVWTMQKCAVTTSCVTLIPRIPHFLKTVKGEPAWEGGNKQFLVSCLDTVHATCACTYQAPTMKPHPMNLAKTVLTLKFKLKLKLRCAYYCAIGWCQKKKKAWRIWGLCRHYMAARVTSGSAQQNHIIDEFYAHRSDKSTSCKCVVFRGM